MFDTQAFKQAVLNQAMQGKLTQQLPEDGNASDLLKSIYDEKKHLIDEGKIKKQKSLPDIDPDEVPFEIPDNWQWVRLGNVSLIASSSRIHKDDWREDGIPFYRAREVVKLSNKEPISNPIFIDPETYDEKINDSTKPAKGDLLFTGVGTLGTSWIVDDRKFYFKDASVLILRNMFNLNSYYLNMFFKSPLFLNQLDNMAQGTAVKTLTIKKASDLILPLPPFVEQHRIVNRIDKCFKLADSIDDEHELNRNFSTNMHKSLLNAAMQGKLTKQLLEDGNASDLIKSIDDEKKRLIDEGKIKKTKELPDIDPDEIPFEIPENWQWVRLNYILDVRDGTHSTPKYINDGIPLITSKNIKDGKIIFDGAKYISKSESDKINERSKVDINDIVMPMIGTIGNPAINTSSSVFSIKNVALIKNNVFVDIKYIYFYLLSIQDSLMKNSSGAVQSFISLTSIRNLLLPLPPFAEQQRIVKKLDSLFSNLNEI